MLTPYYRPRRRKYMIFRVIMLLLALAFGIFLTACAATVIQQTAPKVLFPYIPPADKLNDATVAVLIAQYESSLKACNAALPNRK